MAKKKAFESKQWQIGHTYIRSFSAGWPMPRDDYNREEKIQGELLFEIPWGIKHIIAWFHKRANEHNRCFIWESVVPTCQTLVNMDMYIQIEKWSPKGALASIYLWDKSRNHWCDYQPYGWIKHQSLNKYIDLGENIEIDYQAWGGSYLYGNEDASPDVNLSRMLGN